MPKLKIAVEYSDGRTEDVTVGRPADLIAFADEFGKIAPDPSGPNLMREASWLVHRALRVEQPFDEWVESLEGLELPKGQAAPEVAEPEATRPPEPEPEPEAEQPTQVLSLEPEGWPMLRAGRTIRTPSGSDWPA